MKTKLKKFVSFLFVFALMIGATYAKDGDSTELVNQINKYKEGFELVLHALVAILAIVGAVIVGQKYMQGDEQASKSLTKWVTGIAIVAMADLVVSFFI